MVICIAYFELSYENGLVKSRVARRGIGRKMPASSPTGGAKAGRTPLLPFHSLAVIVASSRAVRKIDSGVFD
jgi:hypothetical protein